MPLEKYMQDPYANSYTRQWRSREKLDAAARRIGRGGWVATRNYELDSGAYFINMLWNYYTTPGLFAPDKCAPLALVPPDSLKSWTTTADCISAL